VPATRLTPRSTGSEPNDSTSVRLLDAAERLIAADGVEAVSLRAINAAAGSNVAATHYHFGSKDALVAAVLQRRMGVIAQERLVLLAPLERQRRPRLRDVVEALALPLFALASSDEGRAYVGFLAMLERAGDRWWRLVADGFAPQWAHFEPILARALPNLADDIRHLRFSVASTTLLNVLVEPERYMTGITDGPTDDRFREAIIDIITGVLAGPRDR
jgi:AcrR family transcriptional regulator